MSLSDLELVAQAMAPTEPGAQTQTRAANGTTNTTTTSTSDSTESADDPLAGLDMSQLSPADRAAVQPIIDALKASEEGEDVDLEDILKQMDAADTVADKLEGRLDALMTILGEMEAGQEDKKDSK